jgi:hypothetical protein
VLNPVRHIEEKFGHGLQAGIVGRKENLPNLLPHLGSAGFTGKQKGVPVLFKERGQVADLGGLAASLDSLEGYEKAQFSSAFLLNELYPK